MPNATQFRLAAIVFRWSVAALLASWVFVSSAPAQPAQAPKPISITGVYNGSYPVENGPIKFKLSITQQDTGTLTGVFTLFLPDGSGTKEYTCPVGGRYIQAVRMVQLVRVVGEAMHDRRTDPATDVVHAGEKIRVRIALVQEQRLAAFDRELQLALEREQLRIARREVAVIVEPGFADRDDFGFGVIFAQQCFCIGVEVAGVMRMHAGGCVQQTGVRRRQRMCVARSLRAGAGHDHGRHALRACTRQHVGQIVAE